MYSNTNNMFNRKSSPNRNYLNCPQIKLGSYRVQEGQQSLRMRPQDINNCWADSPPLSFSTNQEVLHMSLTQLRAEDYYLIRNRLISTQHQQFVNRAVQECAYNGILNRVPCQPFRLSALNQPYDLERIKREKQLHSKKSQIKPLKLDNICNMSKSNIFCTNQAPPATQTPLTNIFSRSTSASTIIPPTSNTYQPFTNTSNNQYRPSSQVNTQNPTGDIFAQNTQKDQPKTNLFNNAQTNAANNQPNNTTIRNIFSNAQTNNANNQPNSNARGNNIFNNANNSNQDNTSHNIPSCSNNIFKNNSTPNTTSSNIFNSNNHLFQNNLPQNSNNIFNRNIFQRQLCNNPSHHSQNIKKEIQISIKLSQDNVVYQKIITTDNNIKIHFDCSHMIQPTSRQHNQAINSIIRSDQTDRNTDRTNKQREREMREKEKREMPVKRDENITIHNFEQDDEEICQESQIRKCRYELKPYWLEEKREDRCIHGSMKIEGFLPNDEEWRRKFIKQLKQNHAIVRKDAELEQLVCKFDRRGIAVITGKIAQKLINLPDYDVEYERLAYGQAQGLKITNKNGSISWQQPVKLVEVDFQELGFAINENEVMMPKNSPLNSACIVTFYRLPPCVEMLVEEDDQDGAFEKLTRIVEKGSQGTATLRTLSHDFWRMHVTKFS